MSAAAGLLGVLALGVGLGLQFNPVTSLAGSLIAAVIFGTPKAPAARRPLAVAVLALAWLAGDGVAIGRSVAVDPPKAPFDWTAIALWALVGALVGYVVPAAAGALVGRRVTRGTGWLSAGAVALAVSGALITLAPALADGITRFTGS